MKISVTQIQKLITHKQKKITHVEQTEDNYSVQETKRKIDLKLEK